MPLTPLSDLAASPVDHIVSLGSSCDVAYNLRRYFDYSTAYPFDWWVSRGSGVAKVLNGTGTDALYDPASLVFQGNGKTDRAVVLNKDLGISFNHEFPREEKQRGVPVVEDYAAYIPRAMERTQALIRRLYSLNKEDLRLLFVRRVMMSERGDSREYDALVETLSRLFPSAQFGVVLVNTTLGRAQLRGAGSLYIPTVRSFGWKGDPALWDAALATLGISLREGLHRPAKKI